jgi:hypothetical protein
MYRSKWRKKEKRKNEEMVTSTPIEEATPIVSSTPVPPPEGDTPVFVPIRRADELGGLLLTFISEYINECPEKIDFFDILEALGKTGVRVMYQSAVAHPQPIFDDNQFKVICDIVNEPLIKMLNEHHFTPAQEMIGLVSSLAYLAQWHNDKIKEYLRELEASVSNDITQ